MSSIARTAVAAAVAAAVGFGGTAYLNRYIYHPYFKHPNAILGEMNNMLKWCTECYGSGMRPHRERAYDVVYDQLVCDVRTLARKADGIPREDFAELWDKVLYGEKEYSAKQHVHLTRALPNWNEFSDAMDWIDQVFTTDYAALGGYGAYHIKGVLRPALAALKANEVHTVVVQVSGTSVFNGAGDRIEATDGSRHTLNNVRVYTIPRRADFELLVPMGDARVSADVSTAVRACVDEDLLADFNATFTTDEVAEVQYRAKDASTLTRDYKFVVARKDNDSAAE